MWQTQIQKMEYGLNDAIGIRKEASYIDILLIYNLWCEFQSILMPTSDFGKMFVAKNLLPFNILILSML